MSKITRPRLEIPFTTFEIVIEALGILSVAAMFIGLIVAFPDLPQVVPMHLSFDGRVDRMDEKIHLIWPPIISLALYILLTLLARFPERFNYAVNISPENAFYQYRNARLFVGVIKAFLSFWASAFFLYTLRITGGLGTRVPFVGPALFVFMASTLILTVFFMRRALRNS